MIAIGLDIGSTTAKVAALSETGELVFSDYRRHRAQVQDVVGEMLQSLCDALGDVPAALSVTGSVGMGVAESLGLQFVQEVVAAAAATKTAVAATKTAAAATKTTATTTANKTASATANETAAATVADGCSDFADAAAKAMIDIGGEDAKVVFFADGQPGDMRMNGNCAGGTGAFIDQMATLLSVDVAELGALAEKAERVWPIASRCGVFCKTDIQNLLSRGVGKADIAASIFHAVAVQTIGTLARGRRIEPPVLLCGGPLSFIPALRHAFAECLHLSAGDFIVPDCGHLLPAIGTAAQGLQAIKDKGVPPRPVSEWMRHLACCRPSVRDAGQALPRLFEDASAYEAWRREHFQTFEPEVDGATELFLGIDSGSTTTKIVALDAEGRVVFTHYAPSKGQPVEAVAEGLRRLVQQQEARHIIYRVRGSQSTGYGENLIRAAFGLDGSMVETMAHFVGARAVCPEVSFILDIGGQDMKAIFVEGGHPHRIEINEACSSGCGSFVEGFAQSLGHSAEEFARLACTAGHPADLGTRCTVFMNSKVKEALRDGATTADIAAGLAYSVVKNCLHKVLKLTHTSVLGGHIVVQGGTMRSDAVVRALELLTGARVYRPAMPELMGAYGCALKSLHDVKAVGAQTAGDVRGKSLDELLAGAAFTTQEIHCHGCSNQCRVNRYRFASGGTFHSGNRCERIFSNGRQQAPGGNAYTEKNALLFRRAEAQEGKAVQAAQGLCLGIPRVLGMYEDFPFWHTLFTSCGLRVVLSDASDYAAFERTADRVMSDNICFPAKLVHSHVRQLQERADVDRIFLPFVVYERKARGHADSFNCPIVTGYSEVVKSVQPGGKPLDAPSFSLADAVLLRKACTTYLATLGIGKHIAAKAFERAQQEHEAFEQSLVAANRRILREARERGAMVCMLAGRPYHADPLIQHDVARMMSGMGLAVITDDIVRRQDAEPEREVCFLDQWAYPARILQAAAWCAREGVPYVGLTSFGCGPDAFLLDEVRSLMVRHGCPFTFLKLDDINNIGSLRLRVRSLVESINHRKP